MKQPPIRYFALTQLETGALKKSIGWRQRTRRQARHQPEKAIHQPQDHSRAIARKSPRRRLKIRQQPVCASRRRAREFGNHWLQLISAKTIQEKMRHNQIKRLFRRRPRERVGADKINSLAVHPLPLEPLARPGEHLRTRIHDRNVCLRQFAAALRQEPPVAFAENQNVLCARDAPEKGRATSLKFVSRRHELHPAIMRRENIKAHKQSAAKDAGSTTIRREWRQQNNPPHPTDHPLPVGRNADRRLQTEWTKKRYKAPFHPTSADRRLCANAASVASAIAAATRTESGGDR